MGLPDHGNGLALKTGGDMMWRKPLSITLEVKRTRTGWTLVIRVRFAL
ncbi:hypothetical protein FHW17_002167 [Phyllobacterium sp. P30BS-XVII]|nr:hypothetical protein [Phyllobacterium sp. P30BS-XVII]